jgi:hypothetical protein
MALSTLLPAAFPYWRAPDFLPELFFFAAMLFPPALLERESLRRGCRKESPSAGLALADSANPGMEVDFQTFWTRTPEGRIIVKNNVTAVRADQSTVRESGHQAKGPIDYAIRTASLFLGHGVDGGAEWAQAHSSRHTLFV